MKLFRGFWGIELLAAVALSVSACGGAGGPIASAGTEAPPGQAPTTADAFVALGKVGSNINAALTAVPNALNGTTIDERLLTGALQTYDAALSVVDALVRFRVLVPNTPRALKVQAALIDTKHWLQAATAAQRAGSAQELSVALSQARLAVDAARAALTR